MANYMYAPGQNLINMNQNAHNMYGTKPIMEQNPSFNHYTVEALDYKIPPQNNNISHQFGGYYPQGGHSSLIHNFVSPLTEKHSLNNVYSKRIIENKDQGTNKHISIAVNQNHKGNKDDPSSNAQIQERSKNLNTQFQERNNYVPNSITQFQERNKDVPNSITQFQERNKDVPNSITQFQERNKDVPNSITQFQERNKDVPFPSAQFQERIKDVPNSISQFQERNGDVPITNTQIQDGNKHVPILKNQNEPLLVLKKKCILFKKMNGMFFCDLCEYSSQKVSSVKSHRMVHTGEKPFQCDLCSKSFRQKEHLKNHRMTHTKEKLFFCNECKYSCAVRSKMDQHNLIHKGIKPYVCTKCDYRCRTPFVMKNHIAKCGDAKTKCNMCNKTFTKAGALAIHKLKHLNDLKFSCKICAYTTKVRVRFKLHLSKEHPKDAVYVCRSCNFTCLKKLQFKIHKSTHDDKRKWFKCDSCPYSSNAKNSLKKHIIEFKNDAIHNNSTSEKIMEDDTDKSIEEIKLDRAKSTKENINKLETDDNKIPNISTSQTEKINTSECSNYNSCNIKELNVIQVSDEKNQDQNLTEVENLPPKSVDRFFFCDLCNFSSRRHRSVKVHKLLHSGERPFLCDLCPASYTRKHHLLKHRSLHMTAKDGKESKTMTIITCDVCGFTCAHKASLQRHQLMHAEKNPNCEELVNMKKFPCNICKLKYTKELHLVKHLKIHLEKGNLAGFLCNPSSNKSLLDQFCDFNQFDYNVQQEAIISQQYQDICKKINEIYHCNACEFTTKNLASIKVHYLIHTGVKPYKCDLCPASYRRKQHLQLHRNRHDKETTYLCHLCDFTSIDKSSMEVHREMHEPKLYECDRCKFSFAEPEELDVHRLDCVQYMCSMCAAIFLDKQLFEKHELSHDEENLKSSESEKMLHKFDAIKDVLKAQIKIKEEEDCDSEADNIPLSKIKIKVETAYSETSYGCNETENQFLYDHFDYGDSCNDNNDADYEVCKEEKHDLSDYEEIITVKKKKSKKKKRLLSKLVQNRNDNVVIRKFKRNQEKKIDGLYHCKFCNYSNKRLNSVKVHRMIHTGERPFLCDVCSATFRQKEHLIKHKKTHVGMKCERSARGNGSEIYDREKSFVCSKCGYICRMKITLDKHEKKCYNAVLKCSTCNETFLTKNELIRHRSIHVELRSYDCELCDFSTGNLLYLKKHTLRHSKMLYLCYVCSFTTVYKSTMQEHRLTHNEKKYLNDDMDGCNYKTKETQQRLESKNDHPNITYNNSIQEPLQHVQEPLLNHPQIITNRIKKPSLHDPFVDPQLAQGMIKTQGRPRKYKLGEFKKENDLYFCDFCDYSNTRVNSVKVHRMIHTDERPFSCDLCSKSFRQKMHLRKHKISHTKEKMFACDVCDFSCRYKSSLDLHKLKHSGVKPYVCEKCLCSYRTQLEMERHVRKCS